MTAVEEGEVLVWRMLVMLWQVVVGLVVFAAAEFVAAVAAVIELALV